MLSLVSEDRAVDPLLPLAGSLVDAVVNELPPHEQCVCSIGVQHELVAWPDEQQTRPPHGPLVVPAVVPLIHLQAVHVTVARHPPVRPNPSFQPTCVSPLRGLPHAAELQR